MCFLQGPVTCDVIEKPRDFGILLPKVFWPTVRRNCSSDREKLLKVEAEGLRLLTAS